MKKKYIVYALFLCGFSSFFYFFKNKNAAIPETVQTVYGDTVVSEPVLLELIHSAAFERLKKINQYGVNAFSYPTKIPYTRYTHSLGVFYLLRKFGASLKEQMAGLLHDVSHTVFSHVGDHVAARMNNQLLDQNDDAYQDCMHVSYLKQTDIAKILERYTIPIDDMDHKCGDYNMLEREYPDICADRLEYVLYGGFIEGWLSEKDIHEIVAALRYENGNWVFSDIVQANKFSQISIRLCEEIFASAWNIGAYENGADALLRAVDIGLIAMQDIHFGHDDELWHLLKTSDDAIIQKSIEKIMMAQTLYEKGSKHLNDFSYVGKFRGIDPLVKKNDEIIRVTELDSKLFHTFYDAKKRIAKTQYYKMKDRFA